jgi:hypothetical protein
MERSNGKTGTSYRVPKSDILFDDNRDKQIEWNKMTSKIEKVRLSSEADSFVWILYSNGKFSIASMYNAILVQANYPVLKPLWSWKSH